MKITIELDTENDGANAVSIIETLVEALGISSSNVGKTEKFNDAQPNEKPFNPGLASPRVSDAPSTSDTPLSDAPVRKRRTRAEIAAAATAEVMAESVNGTTPSALPPLPGMTPVMTANLPPLPSSLPTPQSTQLPPATPPALLSAMPDFREMILPPPGAELSLDDFGVYVRAANVLMPGAYFKVSKPYGYTTLAVVPENMRAELVIALAKELGIPT